MRGFLLIIWIIILAGIIFLAVHFFGTDDQTVIENTPEIDTTELINNEEESENIQIPRGTTNIQTPENINTTPVESNTTENNSNSTTQGNSTKTYTDYINSGDKYFQDLDFENAIIEYEQAVKLNPKSKDPLNKLAESYLKNNQPKEAEKTFTKILQIDPSILSAKIGLVRSFLNQRNFEKAHQVVAQLPKSDYNVKYYAAITLLAQGDYQGAKNSLNEIVIEESQASENTKSKAQHLLTQFDTYALYKDEEFTFQQALLAKALVDLEEYEVAISILFEVINEKNNYRDAWIVLGYSYLSTDKYQDAIDSLLQAKDLDPEKPETYFYLGIAYYANQEIDKAIFFLEKAEDYGFTPVDLLEAKLADLYLLEGNHRQAAAKYESVIANNKSSLEIYYNAIWLNIESLDQPNKALELAQEVIEQFPNSAMSYNLVGWAHLELNNIEHAQKYLAYAIELDPKLDVAYLNLGKLFQKQNMTLLAKEQYKKAYILGHGTEVGKIAIKEYNKLNKKELNKVLRASVLDN